MLLQLVPLNESYLSLSTKIKGPRYQYGCSLGERRPSEAHIILKELLRFFTEAKVRRWCTFNDINNDYYTDSWTCSIFCWCSLGLYSSTEGNLQSFTIIVTMWVLLTELASHDSAIIGWTQLFNINIRRWRGDCSCWDHVLCYPESHRHKSSSWKRKAQGILIICFFFIQQWVICRPVPVTRNTCSQSRKNSAFILWQNFLHS